MDMNGTVLLIEDDEPIRSSLQSILEDRGYRVQLARNGKEGLELLREGARPNVILLDLMMPVMTGSMVLEVLRNDPDLCRTPVVIMSAWLHNWTQNSRSTDHIMLQKPIDPDQLLEIVRRSCLDTADPPAARQWRAREELHPQ
jgi:two-component system cell cycle sensor histidine kinase/response regulator CckA